MGKPRAGNAAWIFTEYIGKDWAPGEVKHLSSQRKRERHLVRIYLGASVAGFEIGSLVIPSVAASERGAAQTSLVKFCVVLTSVKAAQSERWKSLQGKVL